MATTTLYLLRHGATDANLALPYRLQGRRSYAGLAPLGTRQAELTRDLLAIRPVQHFYTSPLKRAVQTAKILAEPRKCPVQAFEGLTECDVGRWEGLTWETVQQQDDEAYRLFLADPADYGYPEGETFAQVAARVVPLLDQLFDQHRGETFLVVGHHVVNRVYLAYLLGLPLGQARQVRIDNCGISIVIKHHGRPQVTTLNATFHLHGASAA
jgi:broad specificity phosphatase PhoE